jgi:glycosyltransferase involved in cell wall biosynthesis
VARLLKEKKMPAPVHFMWLGAAFDKNVAYQLRYDIDKLGLNDTVHFIGPRINVFDYLAASNCFGMFSREEPLSIAMIEAASLGKPIICFDSSGGPPEFVEDDAGYIVPYLDIGKTAEAIISLSSDAEKCRAMGEIAASKARARHDMNIIGQQMIEAFNLVKEKSLN